MFVSADGVRQGSLMRCAAEISLNCRSRMYLAAGHLLLETQEASAPQAL